MRPRRPWGDRSVLAALSVLAVVAQFSCDAGHPSSGSAAAQERAPGTGGRRAGHALAVAGYRDSVVIPPDLRIARPLVVVLHGMGDRPDSICSAFDVLIAGRAWILCPRGDAYPGRPDAWTFATDSNVVSREVHAAIASLERAYPNRVDATNAVMVGFSLGAMHAAFLAQREARSFSRTLVIDTHHVWSVDHARRYASDGGQAACFVCSRGYVHDCERLSRDGALARSASPARTVTLPEREHGYDERLMLELRAPFAELVGGDSRFGSAAR